MRITDAKEVWVHGKRVGILAEDWFYPAGGVRLAAEELVEIANALAPPPEPVRTVLIDFWYDIDNNGTIFCGPGVSRVLIDGNTARENKSLFDYIQQESYPKPSGRGLTAKVREAVWNEIKELGRLV